MKRKGRPVPAFFVRITKASCAGSRIILYLPVMILEVAILHVKPGQTSEFEAAFSDARHIIGAMKGFINLQLQRCLENDHQYVLLINWETLRDHTEGFRQSPEYQQWKALLHHFYDPFPEVLHYKSVSFHDERNEPSNGAY